MPDVVLDVQAVQSRAHGERGIARYTVDLALAVDRLAPGLVDAFVVNPALPISHALAPIAETGRLRRADDPELAGGALVYHVGSPFESLPLDQILPAPVVDHRTRVVTTAYDLIPLRFEDVYLRDPAQNADYRMRAALLRSSSRVVAISDATATDVAAFAGASPRRITPIYGGASAKFVPPTRSHPDLLRRLRTAVPTLPDRYALVPSGIEWRKNLDRLFQAWASLDPGIRATHGLVVQCHVTDGQRDDLQRRLSELGILDEVTFTGFVSDDVLIELYQAAHLTVFPSLYEGLGLPVLEARRCGSLVICSDNSSLRELVPLPEARFDAMSVPAIADRLRAGLVDEGQRARIAECAPPDHFTWDAAGRAFAEVLEQELAAARRVRRHRPPPRLGIVTPLTPEPAGPAKYFDHLLPGLAERADVTLFTAREPETVQLPAVPRPVHVERLSLLEHHERLGTPFDEVLYFFGNSEYHLFYPEFLRRRPGAVLLHDARLGGLYRELARLRPDLAPGGFHGVLHRMYPGRYAHEVGLDGGYDIDQLHRFGIAMVADVARTATRLLVHSHHAADVVELDCGRRPDVAFPHPVPPPGPVGSREPTLVGSFGIVAPSKAPDDLIRAIALDPGLRLVFVGPIGDGDRGRLSTLAGDSGCLDRVEFTGEVDDADYAAWLARVGVMAQLRRTSNGESSGAVGDAIANGVPLVVSRLGSFDDLPDAVAAKVPVAASPEQLAAVLGSLATDPAVRRPMIDAQAAYAAANTYDAAAEQLVEVLLTGRG